MPTLNSRLLALLLGIVVFSVVWSCSQPSDIETPVADSELTLGAERLPAPPSGMIYQLWAIKNPVTGTSITPADAVSLGRFSFENNDARIGFLDESGAPRSDRFSFSGDLFEFQSIVVSVEQISSSPVTPSNIMLMDRVTGIADIPIRLNFPLSSVLWDAIVRYNMEAVSDNNRSLGDGSGVWFSTYRATLDTLPDTTALNVSFVLTEIIPEISIVPPFDTLNLDSLKASYPWDIVTVRAETNKVAFLQDTILLGPDSGAQHIRIAFDIDSLADSTYPYESRRFTFNYSIPNRNKSITLDIFTQDKFALPDLTAYGWKYKGWVVSPNIVPVDSATAPRLTSLGWRHNLANKNWIPGDDGVLLTTGTFSLVDQPDDANPFSLPLVEEINGTDTVFKHPNYPGEDFLNPVALAAAGVVSPVNLMPSSSGNIGTVFITLEPTNSMDTTVNFPLVAFIGAVPSTRATISQGLNSPIQVNMLNATQTVINDLIGFPEVSVSVKRF